MVIDGTYIVSGRYAVHVEFDEFLARNEYDHLCENMQEFGAVAIPRDRWSRSAGDLEVESAYYGSIEDLDQALEDMEDHKPGSEEWIEARETVETVKKLLAGYTVVEYGYYTLIVDNPQYKEYCGSDVTKEIAREYLENYVAMANNECVHVAVIPLVDGSEGWEDKIESLDYREISDLGGEIIPVPDVCLLDHEVIKVLNDSGYPAKDNAKFIEVDL